MKAIEGQIRSGSGTASNAPTLLTGVGFVGLASGIWIKTGPEGKLRIGDNSITQSRGLLLNEGEGPIYLPLSKTDSLFVLGVEKLDDNEEPFYNHSYSWIAV